MSEPAKPQRRYLRATFAGGAGGVVAVLFFLLEERPQLARLLLERVIIAWGPQFIIVLLLIVFFYLLADRYVPRLITAQSETALALQHLAGAVEQLLSRDNAFQREQDVLLNHVARRVDSLHRLFESHHRALNGRLARLARLPGAKAANPREVSAGHNSRPAKQRRPAKRVRRSRTS
ncbi:MAG: hypothetical protein V3U28_08165 [Candidatus Acidoferrales bacterium]